MEPSFAYGCVDVLPCFGELILCCASLNLLPLTGKGQRGNFKGSVCVSQNHCVLWRLGRRGEEQEVAAEEKLPPHPLQNPLTALLPGPVFNS